MLPEWLTRKVVTAWTRPAWSGHDRVRTNSRPGCGRGDTASSVGGLDRGCVLRNVKSYTQHGRGWGAAGQGFRAELPVASPYPTEEARMATRWTVTIDCARPAELAGFWALALGYVERPAPAGFGSWEEWFAHH